MSWIENISLKNYNTFRIGAMARYFASFSTQEQLIGLLEQAAVQAGVRTAPLILGGGSNILLTGDTVVPVLRNEIRGIDLLDEDEDYLYVRAGAGENWHGFVQYCLERDWAGVENLSLIPGSVGAAPMQNIGAYGVELKEVFYELEAWDLEDGRARLFTLNDCRFGYRDSVFKREGRGRFVILNVTFRLRRTPVFHTAYGAIREELEKMGVRELSIRAVSAAVIRIRTAKLPDPAQIGNAGSFFKNPTIPGAQFAALREKFPAIVGYPEASSGGGPGSAHDVTAHDASTDPLPPVKVAAGWLIEQCGRKGYRRGDAGVHARQALVLVNYGRATGREIYDLSEEILQSVHKKFGITLEREVNII